MDRYIVLACPTCGARASHRADAERLVCDYCGNESVFSAPRGKPEIQKPVEPERPSIFGYGENAAQASQSTVEPLRPQPKELQISLQNGVLTLAWRWFSPKFIFLVIFCVLWIGFLCFWYSMAIMMWSTAGSASLIMFLFPLLHVAIGVGLSYYTVAGLFNTTTLTVDRRSFSVRHHPIPWFGQVNVPTVEIAQLYCKEQIHRSRRGGTSISYQLCAVQKDGKLLKLASGLQSSELALFVEHKVESFLRIPDTPVSGEYK